MDIDICSIGSTRTLTAAPFFSMDLSGWAVSADTNIYAKLFQSIVYSSSPVEPFDFEMSFRALFAASGESGEETPEQSFEDISVPKETINELKIVVSGVFICVKLTIKFQNQRCSSLTSITD